MRQYIRFNDGTINKETWKRELVHKLDKIAFMLEERARIEEERNKILNERNSLIEELIENGR